MEHLITGTGQVEHVTSGDIGSFNAGVIGSKDYVLNRGEKFRAEIISNNQIRLYDGDGIQQGRHWNIPMDGYVDVTIDNGLQDVQRYDLIVHRYTHNPDTKIETGEIIVIKGTSSENPVVPEYEDGDIFANDLVADMLLYRVKIDGVNIVDVTPLFNVMVTMEELNNKLNNCLPLSGGTVKGNILTSLGGCFAADGNVYINSGGYADWISDIFNKCIFVDGRNRAIDNVSDLNDFRTGISLFSESVANLPTKAWYLVIAGGESNSTIQLAVEFWTGRLLWRYCAGGKWGGWNNATLPQYELPVGSVVLGSANMTFNYGTWVCNFMTTLDTKNLQGATVAGGTTYYLWERTA